MTDSARPAWAPPPRLKVPAAGPISSGSKGSEAGLSYRVLVVEDSAVIQRLVAVCLRPAGVEVETRGDGPSGLEAALATAPDLMILDVGLPRMDGWEVLERIRSDERTRKMKVLVLTAHAQEETRERADRGGADAFLTKPFRPDDLRAEALRLLGDAAAASATA